ncbi:MAG TPA: hypothetical protein VJ571_08855 [Candidatus Nitrosotalea sp.]|nr:hypothetical protein [Candidatus Nitrosotalea sp.]
MLHVRGRGDIRGACTAAWPISQAKGPAARCESPEAASDGTVLRPP